MHKQSPIGIFDSGLGGISVLSEIHSFLPKEDLLFLMSKGIVFLFGENT